MVEGGEEPDWGKRRLTTQHSDWFLSICAATSLTLSLSHSAFPLVHICFPCIHPADLYSPPPVAVKTSSTSASSRFEILRILVCYGRFCQLSCKCPPAGLPDDVCVLNLCSNRLRSNWRWSDLICFSWPMAVKSKGLSIQIWTSDANYTVNYAAYIGHK